MLYKWRFVIKEYVNGYQRENKVGKRRQERLKKDAAKLKSVNKILHDILQ